jgi:RNA polymerase sigma factor (sigma-70 family)
MAAGELRFEDSFERLFARSFHVAFRILGHSGEAEDVASDAMARALRSWRRVRGMASPDGWVVRVTTNLAIDQIRRNQRLAEKTGAGTRSASPSAVAVAAATVRSDEVDARIDLHRVLGTLPRRQREVLALRYLADLSEAETAALLGIARGTVKRHANRGISKMREEVLEVAS